MALSFLAAAAPLLLVAAAVVLILLPLYHLYYIRFFRGSKNNNHNTNNIDNVVLLQPREWPLVGVVPWIIWMLSSGSSFHDSMTSFLAAGKLLNFRLNAPPRTGLRFFLTCDPENVRHIFTQSFANYPKGGDFATVFPLLEGTIFTADGEAWRRQRRRIHHVVTSAPVAAAAARACRRKVEDGLVPALAGAAAAGAAVDAQDVLGRLVFDVTVMLLFGEDPCSLSPAAGPVPVAEALDVLMEAAFFRHTVPTACWKAMRRLGVGPERNAAAAEAVLQDFVAQKIQARRKMMGGAAAKDGGGGGGGDILSHYMADEEDPDYFAGGGEPTEFMHRTFINFLVALRDPVSTALPWLVYCLATHPRVVAAVRAELAPIAAAGAGGGGTGTVVFEQEELKPLVYLQAAVLESLRLYPPGPIERKVAAAADVLPSGGGHAVRAGDVVLVMVYSMARMESVWGDDCREYRPERWLYEDDDAGDGRRRVRFVPSYKFLSFNTGPRSCLGKSIAVAQMMSVAAAVAWNLEVEVVEGHAVVPKLSVLLQMKNGLMLRVRNRRHAPAPAPRQQQEAGNS